MARKITEENRRRLAEWEDEALAVTPEAIAKRKAEAKIDTARGNVAIGCIILVVACVFVCPAMRGCLANAGRSGDAAWTCTEFDAPYEVVLLRGGKVDIYSGVNRPNTANVKGHAEGGSVGIETMCKEVGVNVIYYRVRGTPGGGELWWGWVKQVDIRR